jgi:hypothetical protein
MTMPLLRRRSISAGPMLQRGWIDWLIVTRRGYAHAGNRPAFGGLLPTAQQPEAPPTADSR